MPDKPIEPGSITQTADAQNERISEVSSVANTVNEMQRDVDQRLTEVEQMAGDSESIAEVQTATVGILHKMQDTMGSFAQGINAITLGTAAATKDAISQYGKAIAEDISYNKQSVVAMALSRSTPLFGYFAAKFMETDVFQKAKDRMSESLKNVFSGVGKTISGFFKGKKKGEEEIPKMQKGGYVKKGGMVEVHAGEIVAPIEKVLSRIDETVGAVQEIGVTFKRAQLKSMANLAGYVKGQQQLEKVGIFKGFMRAMNQVQTQYEEPSNIRLLRAVLSIQDTLGATIGTMEQVWTKMLVEHPTFRNIMFSLRTFSSVLSLPGRLAYSVFKARGGYKSQLPSSKNLFENISLILGLLYAESMHRLDNISLYTRATAEATRDLSTYTTGKKYAPLVGVPRGFWSIISIARKMLNLSAKWMPAVIAGGIDIMFGGSGKAGWKKGKAIGDFFSKEREIFLTRWMDAIKKMGWKGGIRSGVYGKGGIVESIEGQKKLRGPVKDKPIPVTIVSRSKELKKIEDKKWRQEKKGLSVQKGVAKDLDEMNKRGKLQSFMKILSGGFGFLKSAVGMVGGLLTSLLPTVLGFLGIKKGAFGMGAILRALGLKKGAFSFLAKGSTFAKFLGPVAGVLIAGGLGAAIGTWLNTYIAPWLNKKWDVMFREGKAARERVTEKAIKESKIARGTEGAAGLQARYKTALTAGLSRAQKVHGMDPKLGLIQEGQQEFFNENINTYMKYPVDMIATWRKEWSENVFDEGSTGRLQLFGWGTNPKKYGKKREKYFLEWLNANKTELTPAQMAAQEKGWTRKVRGAQGLIGSMKNMRDKAVELMAAGKTKAEALASLGLEKGTEAYEKVAGTITEKAEIAKDYAKGMQAQVKPTIDALKQHADKTMDSAKKMTEKFGDTVGQQATTLVNTVTDNSQKIVNTGGQRAGNLYQDLKKTVITGKLDMDTLELFWD